MAENDSYAWLDAINPFYVKEAQAAVAVPAHADMSVTTPLPFASVMESFGSDPKTIYDKTGYFRAANGLWHTLKNNKEELYKAVPSLRNVSVTTSGERQPGVPSSYQRNMTTGVDNILIIPDRRPDTQEQEHHEFGHAAAFHANPQFAFRELMNAETPYNSTQEIDNFIMQAIKDTKDPKEIKAMLNVVGRPQTNALAAYDEIKAELQLQKINPEKYKKNLPANSTPLQVLKYAAKMYPNDFATSNVRTGAKNIKDLLK